MLKQVSLLSVLAISLTGCVVAPFDDGSRYSSQYGYGSSHRYSNSYGYERPQFRPNQPQYRPHHQRPQHVGSTQQHRPWDNQRPNVQRPSQHKPNVNKPQTAKPQTTKPVTKPKPNAQSQKKRPNVAPAVKLSTGGFNAQRPLRPQI